MKKAGSATDPLWYKDAVIYEIHIRAFMDSNADGIGDFPGLMSKLDYLQDLGVTCLWLLPFFPSPLRDDGYDIANYVDVNPSYGTLNDFKQFLDAAHLRGMQVMIELVINHTSDQHPWFKAARSAPKGSPERDMYVWSDTDKLFEGVRIIFTDTEKSNWTWDEVAQQYYWHRFFSHQPDLNFDNPRVMEEVLSAMRFWLDMGVDGLRLDAIPYLVERDGTSCENVPETHVKIKEIRAAIDADYDNRLVLAEANMWPADVRPYFGDGDECNMAFHFPLMPRIYMALRQEDRLPITDIMAQTPAIPDNCQWGLFLRNHDELTLEMVTDDERDYMYLAYSADPRMRINVGIRRRLAPLVDNNRRRIELLNSLLLSFPGTPILYYGDEIGMGDNIYLGDRNGVRTPMQWNSDRNAGFSKSVPAQLYFPVIMDPIWGYQSINVEAQQSDQSSLLHWTRNMIALRKLFKVFGRGTQEFLNPENRKILAYVRQYEENGSGETVLCVANLSRFSQPVSLDLSKFTGMIPVEMLGYVTFPTITTQPYPLTLAPYSFLWLELQPSPMTPEPVEVSGDEPIVNMFSGGIEGILAGDGLVLLRELLISYLPRQRWFGAKSRTIKSVEILDSAQLPDLNAVIVFLHLLYADGGSDSYQLALTISTGNAAEMIRASDPASVVATVTTVAGPAVLHDAIAREDIRQAILQLIESNGNLPMKDGSLQGHTSSAFAEARGTDPLPARTGSAEQSNTSILYDAKLIIKLFRRLQPGENPDTEIGRFLTETAHFPRIAPFLGDITLHSKDGEPTTVAMLQGLVENEGDGWQWTLDELSHYYDSVAILPALQDQGTPASFLVENEIPIFAREHAGLSLDAAALLGRRTAEMHLALATPTRDAAFSVQDFTTADLVADADRIDKQLSLTLDALKRGMPQLTETTADNAALVLSRRIELFARARAIASATPTEAGQRTRIHGDYHLGQVLRSRGDYVILDFEGEPARSLADRRAKQSPLRDVAGMLRSFSYAAHAAHNAFAQRRPDDAKYLEAWATLWQNSVCTEFLRAWRTTIQATKPELIPNVKQAQLLLNAYLLEKSLYELLYELDNRPTWVKIPLAGILSLHL
ncbi:maltose alpha-D-glucosyltransferase [Granulicella sp. S190]|uniref:maltose alpha-D-glucosyltransferase n=1 Tax=Granulicella sp. S190 TaxID=1747226 RepID=UPI00131C58DE|nr:maltose alpha-D-glucosyltransferase [Granulicella sp. S190]